MPRDYDALVAFLDSRAAYPFARAGGRRDDCIRNAAKAVRAQTGRDPLEGLSYRGAKAASGLLAEFGGLANAIGSRLREVPLGMAQRGDVGLVVLDGVETVCIIEGEHLAVPASTGLRRLPRVLMSRAWSAD